MTSERLLQLAARCRVLSETSQETEIAEQLTIWAAEFEADASAVRAHGDGDIDVLS